jgi:hypothetical protein
LDGRCLVQCSVRSMGVEVGHVLGQHDLKLAPVEDEHPVQQLAAEGADPSFGDGVCSGASTGVRRMRMASLANTASNTSVNLLSRSWIKNLN